MVSLFGLRASVLSLLLFGLFIGVWHLATAGTGAISLTGATLAPNASCSFSANVIASAVGTYLNTTSAVTSG